MKAFDTLIEIINFSLLLVIIDADEDKELKIFRGLFKKRRTEQIAAIARLTTEYNYQNQFQMVQIIADRVHKVLKENQAKVESSGYIFGSGLPENLEEKDALANTLENTVFFSEIILKLPDLSQSILAQKEELKNIMKWSIGFCNNTNLLDHSSMKVLHLVAQEMNITERHPDYVNPYRKIEQTHRSGEEKERPKSKKPKRQRTRGPQLSDARVDL